MQKGKLNIELLGRGFAWLDTGTHQSLLQASQYVQTIEENQGIKIACLEEISYRLGFLSADEILRNIPDVKDNEYYNYIKGILK